MVFNISEKEGWTISCFLISSDDEIKFARLGSSTQYFAFSNAGITIWVFASTRFSFGIEVIFELKDCLNSSKSLAYFNLRFSANCEIPPKTKNQQSDNVWPTFLEGKSVRFFNALSTDSGKSAFKTLKLLVVSLDIKIPPYV